MPNATLLTSDQENIFLQNHSGWSINREETPALSKQYTFKNFIEAMEFVNKIAELAEEAKHHPDISISYNKVTLTLTTHDAKGLTEKDVTLAKRIDEYIATV